MAEGLLNVLYGDKYEAYSAGTEPSQVNPYAIKAMAEIDIDISGDRSKSIEEFQDMKFDYVVTVCNHAKEACPYFPEGEICIHKSFVDPSSVKGSDDKKMMAFRIVRDEIRRWIYKTFGELPELIKL